MPLCMLPSQITSFLSHANYFTGSADGEAVHFISHCHSRTDISISSLKCVSYFEIQATKAYHHLSLLVEFISTSLAHSPCSLKNFNTCLTVSFYRNTLVNNVFICVAPLLKILSRTIFRGDFQTVEQLVWNRD